MKYLTLKNRLGQIIRVFRCETEKAFLVYRFGKGRLDLCSSPYFFEGEPVALIEEIDISQARFPRPAPAIQGFLELCDKMPDMERAIPKIALRQRPNSFWPIFGAVSVICFLIAALAYGLAQIAPQKKNQLAEIKTVKILKPPVSAQPKKMVLTGKRAFIQTAKTQKKPLKRSLKKMGALSALGSLPKKDAQKEGLNFIKAKVSAGPGFRSVAEAASGGAQSSLYSKGMIASALGSGGNIRGGGGHGARGSAPGGGAEGYGALSLVGSGGEEDLSSFVGGAQEGGLDFSLIEREIIKRMGQLRLCYDMALKSAPDLKGLLKIHFAVNPKGGVGFSAIHKLSEVRSPEISSCVLKVIDQIRFPVRPSSAARVNYAFDLSDLGTEEGGEE